ncbi:hypothetical protein L5515_001644 [Caenorhabditis briggsae]|uniref:Anti-proliferative protein domain-containing protein n=1 Tax=Caenorhabditis briggsae TaxID=6238 RepID=A0AAE9E233_CAEBR|nr:hypothetical protein L5515_001644 [Caenorhabditis briggsae]
MYTEVKELVNFVCRYMFGRVPRRATGIFAAELGNCLVAQFSSSWDIKNPRNGQMERMIFIKCGADGSSKCFEGCAAESGLRADEVLENMPTQLRIFANPGLLFYRATENGVDVPIWKGDVNTDSHYQPIPEHIVRTASRKADSCSNLGGAGKPVLLNKKFPIDDLAVLELVNNMYIPLALEKCDEINSNLSHIREKYPFLFTFKPTSAQTYSGIEFSQTRFGSSKSRQDLQTMVGIKQLVNSNQNNSYCDQIIDTSIYSNY